MGLGGPLGLSSRRAGAGHLPDPSEARHQSWEAHKAGDNGSPIVSCTDFEIVHRQASRRFNLSLGAMTTVLILAGK